MCLQWYVPEGLGRFQSRGKVKVAQSCLFSTLSLYSIVRSSEFLIVFFYFKPFYVSLCLHYKVVCCKDSYVVYEKRVIELN